jgi:hypothetical protein
VLKAPIAGGDTVVLATGQSRPATLALDEDTVYWANSGVGAVMKVAKTGGDPVVVADNEEGAWAVAVDANNVYWTTAKAMTAEGTIKKRAKK